MTSSWCVPCPVWATAIGRRRSAHKHARDGGRRGGRRGARRSGQCNSILGIMFWILNMAGTSGGLVTVRSGRFEGHSMGGERRVYIITCAGQRDVMCAETLAHKHTHRDALSGFDVSGFECVRCASRLSEYGSAPLGTKEFGTRMVCVYKCTQSHPCWTCNQIVCANFCCWFYERV